MALSPGGRPADASPLGRKGPRKTDDYTRMVAHALMREHGFSKQHAIATARNAIRRWIATGKKPQVRGAAAASYANQKRLDRVRTGRGRGR